MAITKYTNDAAGRATVAAIPDPKHIWRDGARIWVYTGSDIPTSEAVSNPGGIVLTTRQLMKGADSVARARYDAIVAYIRGIVGVDAKDPADQIAPTGTINEQKYWRWHNASIRRSDAIVNAMRTAIGLTPAQMDQIFIAGSTMDP